jgi:hypothetical protein
MSNKPEVMTAQQFQEQTRFHTFSLKRKRLGENHPLRQIHGKLLQYEGKSKANVQDRWRLLAEIAADCVAYVGSKPPKKQETKKTRAVKRCALYATLRLAAEQHKAQALKTRFTPTGRGVNVGGTSSHDKQLRFERLIKPGTVGIRGDDLVAAASDAGVELTGDETIDFYAMKKFLKNLRTTDAAKLRLIYFGDEQRDEHRLQLSKSMAMIFDSGNRLFHTLDNDLGVPSRTAMYAASLQGAFFAKNYADTREARGTFHHSSFLAGETALGAGTLKVDNGVLLEVSNLSGHYGPTFDNLLDCATLLWTELGLQNNIYHWVRAYVVYADFHGVVWPQNQYRVPIKDFVEWGRALQQPEAFSGLFKRGNDAWTYDNPDEAQRRGCMLPRPGE